MDSRPLAPYDNDTAAGGREKSRDSLFLQAVVVAEGRPEPISVRVRNLSTGGMLAESNVVLADGTAVVTDLPNIGAISARVVWSANGKFGLAFDQPIDPQAVRRKVVQKAEVPAVLSGLSMAKRPIRRL